MNLSSQTLEQADKTAKLFFETYRDFNQVTAKGTPYYSYDNAINMAATRALDFEVDTQRWEFWLQVIFQITQITFTTPFKTIKYEGDSFQKIKNELLFLQLTFDNEILNFAHNPL